MKNTYILKESLRCLINLNKAILHRKAYTVKYAEGTPKGFIEKV